MTEGERSHAVSKNHKKVWRRYASHKLGRLVSAESRLEYDFLVLIDHDDDVDRFDDRPFSIVYGVGGKDHLYTPDFVVSRRSSVKELVEIKNSYLLSLPETKQIVEVGELFAAAHGYRFLVLTEKEIWGARIDNLKVLHRYSRVEVPVTISVAVRKALQAAGGEMSRDELAAALAPSGPAAHPLIPIYALLHEGRLAADLDIPLSGTTRLRLNPNGEKQNGTSPSARRLEV
jgi:hypothetical protein